MFARTAHSSAALLAELGQTALPNARHPRCRDALDLGLDRPRHCRAATIRSSRGPKALGFGQKTSDRKSFDRSVAAR